MKLSAPIYQLKSRAKALRKSCSCTLSKALDQVAQQEGFSSWSLLQSKTKDLLPKRYEDILDYFNEGDLVLLGARPMVGKTSFATGLFVKSVLRQLQKNYYYSLAEIGSDVVGRMKAYASFIEDSGNMYEIDCTDEICADYIIGKTTGQIGPGSLVVIDYLQLLDERRVTPPIQEQVQKLKSYAQKQGCIIIFIAQINRKVEYRADRKPSADDVRLPNPLDLKLFNKMLFLSKDDAEIEVVFAGKTNHKLQVSWNEIIHRVG